MNWRMTLPLCSVVLGVVPRRALRQQLHEGEEAGVVVGAIGVVGRNLWLVEHLRR